ncbi:hypothetical protein [Pseudoclavibacter soli]|uniref:hypothetical protein n=1 Tax=Pseudoclavibacter soli TaxID=452623 RepID=UPI00146D7034|nr:hypothetical protein [Pseudoclavibacter soli]
MAWLTAQENATIATTWPAPMSALMAMYHAAPRAWRSRRGSMGLIVHLVVELDVGRR